MSDRLFTTLAENEARLVSAEGEPSVAGYRLVREWVYLRADLAEDVFVTGNNAQDDVEVTDPKASGETYTGTFAGTQVVMQESTEDDDRQVRVRQTLTLVTSIDDALGTDLPSNPRWEYVDEEINHMEFEDSGDPWVVDRQRIKLIYENLAPSSLQNLADTAKSVWETEADAIVSIGGWEYQRREFEKRSDGTLAGEVFFTENDFNADDTLEGEHLMNTVNDAGFAEVRVEKIKGKDIANAESTAAALTADTGFVITEKSWREAQAGEAHINKVQKTAYNYTDADYRGNFGEPTSVEKIFATGNQTPMYRFVWHRVRSTDVASLYSAAEDSLNYGTDATSGSVEWNAGTNVDFTNLGYVIKSVRKQEHGDTTVSIISTIWIPRSSTAALPSDTEYSLRRTSMEVRSRENPPESGLNDDPEGGRYWRLVYTDVEVEWTDNENDAYNHAAGGLHGSFSKFDMSRGLFYAERVINRDWSVWFDVDPNTVTGALGNNATSNLLMDVT